MNEEQLAGQVEANPDGEAEALDTSQEIETTTEGVEVAQTQDESGNEPVERSEDGAGDEPAESDDEAKGESRSQRKRRLARERQEQIEKENADLKARLDRIEEQKSKLKPPNPSDYDNDADYYAANAAYAARKSIQDEESDNLTWEQSRRAQETERLRQDAIQDVNDRAMQRYSDFNQKLEAAKPVLATAAPSLLNALREAVVTDEGADLAYYLSVNPHEVPQFNGMSDVQAAMRLGQIAASLPKVTPKKATTAPAPINTVKPTAVTNGAAELERLRKEAAQTGDMTKVIAFKRKMSAG